MSAAADYAFALAYKSWLECDFYYVSALSRDDELDGLWVREIGSPYLINRTITRGSEGDLASLILRSGQGNGMGLEHRAARLALALENWKTAGAKAPASAATKLSWFVWPQGWTMYDRFAGRAVLGSPADTGIDRMERFYAALAMRGWDEQLTIARQILSDAGMHTLLAERTLDKYLFLLGSDAEAGDPMMSRIDGFLKALPPELRECIDQTGEAFGALLESSKLAHRDNNTDRSALRDRVDALRKFKREIA